MALEDIQLSTACPGCGNPMVMRGVDSVPEPCGDHCISVERPNHVVLRMYFMGFCSKCQTIQESSHRV